mmetsp:Transcript_908/g.3332  ORF Transcript_908/g.3332 Transcript_908/m.3332 type:complete len:210 (-) Transcript_908:471-1100(-)
MCPSCHPRPDVRNFKYADSPRMCIKSKANDALVLVLLFCTETFVLDFAFCLLLLVISSLTDDACASSAACFSTNVRMSADTSPVPITSSLRGLFKVSVISDALLCVSLVSSATTPSRVPVTSPPPFLLFTLRRRPQAMIENRGSLCPLFAAFGTPCLKRLFTSDVNAKTSPLFCGKVKVCPLGSCKNTSSRDPPNEAPMVKSSRCARPP